jgi:hypothetical protein
MRQDTRTVEIEMNGRKYLGSYYVEKGLLTVFTGCERKSAQIEGSTPEGLARLMLWEMLREGTAGRERLSSASS